jgi:hypothetical protein
VSLKGKHATLVSAWLYASLLTATCVVEDALRVRGLQRLSSRFLASFLVAPSVAERMSLWPVLNSGTVITRYQGNFKITYIYMNSHINSHLSKI